MRYEFAPDIQKIAENVSKLLFPHVKIDKIKCIRSYGSSTRNTIARCHALGKVMQKAMEVKAFYALEFLSERFDNLDKEEQVKIVIHELMHIPNSFGGGFKHHNYVTEKNVNLMYKQFKKKENENDLEKNWFKS